MATSVQDTKDMHEYIGRVFDAKRTERARAVERLLAEMLDFGEPEHRQLSLEDIRDKEKRLPKTAKRLGQLGGVHALYIELPKGKGERVRQREAEAVAREVQSKLGDEMLLIFSDYEGTQLNWIYPEFKEKRPTLRRIAIEAGTGRRTAVVQLAKVYDEYRKSQDIEGALGGAFDVEPVTKQFFREYKRIFGDAMSLITGIDDETEKHLFVQTLFNRLMFVYFLSRKRWLSFEGDTDYLNALWRGYEADPTPTSFYRDRLFRLFHIRLNNPQSADLSDGDARTTGDVPFLNGGLFELGDHDEAAVVPDDVIVSVLRDLFDAFNFTVMESTPYDIEVAVDPEMLGKVFEELVTGRNEKGAYYTPRPVVSFMCREALKGYLKTRVDLDDAVVDTFVDEREAGDDHITEKAADDLLDALRNITVVDPACGSGAYLLGMMQELLELRHTLLRRKRPPVVLYQQKLDIIQNNLYGGDVEEFAVNLAMLRLWLSLAIEHDGDKPEPLPNLDLKILKGDSLLAPDPSQGFTERRDEKAQMGLGRDPQRLRLLTKLKGRYMRESDSSQKSNVKQQINDIREQIQTEVTAAPKDSVDWRIDCVEVFEQGGFDIAIANPPYARPENQSDEAREALRGAYGWPADLYEYFIIRGFQLVKDRGILCYVTNDSFITFSSKLHIREEILRHRLDQLIRLPAETFEATIYTVIAIASKTAPADGHAYACGALEFPDYRLSWHGSVSYSTCSILPDQRLLVSSDYALLTRLMDLPRADSVCHILDAGINSGNVRHKLFFAEDTGGLDRLIQGRQIERYSVDWDSPKAQYKYCNIHYEPQPVPGIGRGGKPSRRNEYWSFRSELDYHHLQERLLMRQTADDLVVAYHSEALHGQLYTDNTLYTIIPKSTLVDIRYLCGLLNSTLLRYCYQALSQEGGKTLAQVKVKTVRALPLLVGDSEQQRNITNLSGEIIARKSTNLDADVSRLETELDEKVFKLYGLTKAEIEAVKDSVGS